MMTKQARIRADIAAERIASKNYPLGLWYQPLTEEEREDWERSQQTPEEMGQAFAKWEEFMATPSKARDEMIDRFNKLLGIDDDSE